MLTVASRVTAIPQGTKATRAANGAQPHTQPCPACTSSHIRYHRQQWGGQQQRGSHNEGRRSELPFSEQVRVFRLQYLCTTSHQYCRSERICATSRPSGE